MNMPGMLANPVITQGLVYGRFLREYFVQTNTRMIISF